MKISSITVSGKYSALQMPVFVDRDVNYLLMNDIKNFDIDPDRDKTILGMYLGTVHGHL